MVLQSTGMPTSNQMNFVKKHRLELVKVNSKTK